MGKDIKQSVLSGVLWSGMEKFALQVFGFIQGVILARLLSPTDYGLISMVSIFVMLSYSFVDAGFGTALIQKQNRSEKDYSTVFVLNIAISLLIAISLYLCRGLIAHFYHEPILVNIIGIYAILVFLSSLIAIQDVRLSIYLEFRKKSIINIITTIVSGLFSIILAFCGYGVWSLLVPQFLSIAVKACLYWHFQHWFPRFYFSVASCKLLFGFGSKILASSILSTIFENIYSLVIGKVYSARDLGYYSRADSYSSLPAKTAGGIIESVAFPVFSQLQEDKQALLFAFIKMLRLSAYIIFPVMMGLAALGKPLVILLVTDKWMSSIILLQLLCFSRMWWHIQVLNLNLLKAKGRSDLFFSLEIIKRVLTIIVLCLTFTWGIIVMCIGNIFISILSMFVNSYYTGKLIDFGIIKQFKEILSSLVLSITMGVIIYCSTYLTDNYALQVFYGMVIGLIYYFGLSYLTKSKDFAFYAELIFSRLKR